MVTIIVNYARGDGEHKDELLDHLQALRLHEVELRAVSESSVPKGVGWKDWIEGVSQEAGVGVLLLTPKFLGSRFCCYGAECLLRNLPPKQVAPVLVQSCSWEGVGWLSGRDLAGSIPITLADDPAAAWKRAAEGLRSPYRRALSRKPGPLVAAAEPSSPGVKDLLAEEIAKGGGRVTLLLGPGIPTASYPEHVRGYLDWLMGQLDDASARSYAESVVKSRLPAALGRGAKSRRPSEKPWSRALLDFQAALARLGGKATHLFAVAMQQACPAITATESFSISIAGVEEPELDALRELFHAATRKARSLCEFKKLRDRTAGFGVRGIHEQLIALTWIVFQPNLSDPDDGQAREWTAEMHEVQGVLKDVTRHRLIRGQTPPGQAISLAQLAWIGDLLWHTLRFQAPIYPTPDALAFQLSVCSRRFLLPKRRTLSMAASEMGLDELQSILRAWLEKVAGHADETCYQASARIVCHRIPAAILEDVTSSTVARHIRLQPLVVTTNFDDRLELTLTRARRSYHSVFPVYVMKSHEVIAPDWILKSEVWDDEWESQWLLLQHSSLGELVQVFEGPLIVKLYGSPLTAIRSKRVRSPEGLKLFFDYRHRMVVSEHDVMRRSWPPGLEELFLRPDRVVCAVGYSMGDSSHSEQLWELLEDRMGEAAGQAAYLIDDKDEPRDRDVLRRLRMTPVAMSIEEFAEMTEGVTDTL